jgi:SAM-dependent methyltransferase
MLRANVGCGLTPTRGWKNFDNSLSLRLARHGALASLAGRLGLLSGPQREYVEFCRCEQIEWADATSRIPLPDGSAEVLYSSHMLEHLDPEDARGFLGEARRVLAAGGILRVSVPDLARHVASYAASGDADAFIAAAHMCVPRPKSLVERLRFFAVGPRHHQWMYDGRSLAKLLQAEGFRDPVALPPGQTTIPHAEPLDLYERADESVYVEARK